MEQTVGQMEVLGKEFVRLCSLASALNEFNGNLQNILTSLDLVASCSAFPAVDQLAETKRAEKLAEELQRSAAAQIGPAKEPGARPLRGKRGGKSNSQVRFYVALDCRLIVRHGLVFNLLHS